jgi:hypothetical protein
VARALRVERGAGEGRGERARPRGLNATRACPWACACGAHARALARTRKIRTFTKICMVDAARAPAQRGGARLMVEVKAFFYA